MADYEIYSEPRYGHWVAWVKPNSGQKPVGEVILVGQTQEEAEANARRWGERLDNDPTLSRS